MIKAKYVLAMSIMVCLCAFIFTSCIIKISLHDISHNIPNDQPNEKSASSVMNDDISKNELLSNIKAKTAKWLDNNLIYVTREGIFKYKPSESSILLSDSIPKTKFGIQPDFFLSPDNTKYLMLGGWWGEKVVEIRDYNNGELILKLDTEKYTKPAGKFGSSVEEAGWFDNETIFLSTKIRLFLININNGSEIQVTQECSPILEKAKPNIEAPYLTWAKNVKKIGSKIYYNSLRELFDPKPKPDSIYCSDWSGETELIKDATLKLAVDDKSFIYTRSNPEQETIETYLYNITTGQSTLITDERIGGILVNNDGKISYITENTSGNNLNLGGVILDPATFEKHEFDISIADIVYSMSSIDNIEYFDKNKIQFDHFLGVVDSNGEYIFLYTIEIFSLYPEKGFIDALFSYSTKTDEVSFIKTYENIEEVFISISPSGAYAAVMNFKKLSDDEFILDVVKIDDLMS